MEMTEWGVFPTLFYKFIFSQDQIVPLVEEIQNKKEEIKKIYRNNKLNPLDDYWTDYKDPIKLLAYEKLIEEISSQFAPQMSCKHDIHWIAIYEARGYHNFHTHNQTLYEPTRTNMSSILYLSDIGDTEFFNPRQSDEIYPSMFIPSEMGKMVIFPSHILHRALPHEKKGEEKIIVSSNWQVHYHQQHQNTAIYFDGTKENG